MNQWFHQSEKRTNFQRKQLRFCSLNIRTSTETKTWNEIDNKMYSIINIFLFEVKSKWKEEEKKVKILLTSICMPYVHIAQSNCIVTTNFISFLLIFCFVYLLQSIVMHSFVLLILFYSILLWNLKLPLSLSVHIHLPATCSWNRWKSTIKKLNEIFFPRQKNWERKKYKKKKMPAILKRIFFIFCLPLCQCVIVESPRKGIFIL